MAPSSTALLVTALAADYAAARDAGAVNDGLAGFTRSWQTAPAME